MWYNRTWERCRIPVAATAVGKKGTTKLWNSGPATETSSWCGRVFDGRFQRRLTMLCLAAAARPPLPSRLRGTRSARYLFVFPTASAPMFAPLS